ncbi:thermonuclease family protein [Mammaliicoccus sciuri]|uniref:thermonuclease family protein n=1 Tax=Mammaliicoccus sciuri TaxID=1296 RepID=UPI003364B6CC
MKKIILLCVSILFLATIESGCSNGSTDNSEKEKSYKPGTTDRIPVELAGTVDGDTAKFIYNGSKQSFRFLLIDTPETKHPRLGKQPFGQEASDRTKELLTNANKIEIEFDVGGQTDKYQRYLTYIYVDGKMLNEILVREGLAKVAYVYPPNTRYLDQLESAQEKAKEEKLGIWSLGSAFEDNQASTQQSTTNQSASNNTQSSIGAGNSATQTPKNTSQNAGSEYYPNCTALRKVYPNGVPSTHPAYNGKLDRDKDNFACEAN